MTSNDSPIVPRETLTLPETSIHRALADAATTNRDIPKAEVAIFSVRLPRAVQEAAQQICSQNATTLGAYFRECAKSLIRDYTYSRSDAEQE